MHAVVRFVIFHPVIGALISLLAVTPASLDYRVYCYYYKTRSIDVDKQYVRITSVKHHVTVRYNTAFVRS